MSQPAYNNSPELSSYPKVGVQGGTGTGKSTTIGLIVLGAAAELYNRRAVYVADTEPGWQFLKPIFDAEGVPLIIRNTRSFLGMHEALKEAVGANACGFVVDSITHPWSELLLRFADSTGRVPFHKFNQIRPLWNEWTRDFLNSPLMAFASGRLTWEYFYEEAEDGKKELIKGDTKMKAGGSESFGYEPHLTCEMYHERKKAKGGKLGGMQYRCVILKDRSRVLNGQEFVWDDIGQYKKGAYKPVFNKFLAHFKNLAQITSPVLPNDTSEALIPNGDSSYYKDQRERTALLEEWDATVLKLSAGMTADEKRFRLILGEAITGVISRTRFEQFPMDRIQNCVLILMRFEERYRSEKVAAEKDIKALVELCRKEMAPITRDFDRSRGVEQFIKKAPEKTLLESQLEKSIEQAQAGD